MVVKITSPHSIKRALNYNEHKVAKGHAVCLGAEGYLLPAEKMNFYQKLERFIDLISLNERAKKSNTLHISLNFDPSEKLEQEKLLDIAKSYMGKIGFEKQPYLIYEHTDAGHPHIHIVTTNIQSDGKRINTFNIGRNQSEKARKEIESAFGLVKAARRVTKSEALVQPSQKALYGKSETRQAITNVLSQVIDHFKYSSLPEVNAVLSIYNVTADRGVEGGRIHKHGGLIYRILDEQGNKTGVPIKASLIYNKPILKKLDEKFLLNQERKQVDKPKLKAAVKLALLQKPNTLDELLLDLRAQSIYGVVKRSSDGRPYGLTFVDFRTKAVFKGSDLGKEFSVGNLIKTITGEASRKQTEKKSTRKKHHWKRLTESLKSAAKVSSTLRNAIQLSGSANQHPVESNARIPYDLMKKKRKKKRRNII